MTAWFWLIACGPKDGTEPSTSTTGLAILGSGNNDVTAQLEVRVQARDGLDHPTDLAFEPTRGELWVVSREDDSVVIVHDPTSDEPRTEHIVDPYALHFMERVSSIAMGPPGRFGTCQDSENTYNDQGPPNDFMGPTLWSSDPQIFGISNPEASEYLTDLFGFPTDLGSHLDMLHESPLCMGIAWDSRASEGAPLHNVYWVFDGYNGNIVRYDFQEDHGPGYDDHGDGIISRVIGGKVKRKEGVMSHIELDAESGLLYIADTGRNRIAVLDTNTGRRGDDLPSIEGRPDHHEWVGAELVTLVDGEALQMSAPSGLALVDGVLYVTDMGTGRIHAFGLDGTELDWAETGRERGIGGIVGGPDGALWMVDSKANEVLRLSAP